MEKFLKTGIAVLLVFVVGYLVYSQFFKTNTPQIGDGMQLPDYSFMRMGGKGEIKRADLRKTHTVVVYFNPNCSHCRALATDLGNKIDYLREIDFVWVTRFDEGASIHFAKSMGLWDKDNVYLGIDREAAFYRFFGDMFVPSVYIYAPDGNLIQQLNQDALVQDIMTVVNGGVSDKMRKTR